MLVVGQIHGNETAGRAVIPKLRRREPPSNVELWLVKDLNPDGLAADTRQNARGVDLNRNFPHDWKRQGDRGSTYYSGPRALSDHRYPDTSAFVVELAAGKLSARQTRRHVRAVHAVGRLAGR